jgi:mannose-6-phosphate isomerase-like protein (cupin superfamily)
MRSLKGVIRLTGYNDNIEELTLNNSNFRQVLFTGKHAQLVVMCLKPGEEIGMEVHDTVDQFFRFEKGMGKVIMNGEESGVSDGSAVIVPAGTNHNIVNTSQTEDLKLYTIYSPPNHPDGTVHKTKEEAMAAEAKHHH